MSLFIQVITSLTTLACARLTRTRVRLSWWLSLGNQGVWLLLIFTSKTWGLLPLWAGLVATFAFNLWRTREDRS